MSDKECCRICEYWMGITYTNTFAKGECVRYPQEVIKGAGQWCGEFRYSSTIIDERHESMFHRNGGDE